MACNINCVKRKKKLHAAPDSNQILATEHVIICDNNSPVNCGILNLQLDNLSSIINNNYDMFAICDATCFDHLEKKLLSGIDDIYVSCNYQKVDDWSHLILWFVGYACKYGKLNNSIMIYLSGPQVNIVKEALDNVIRFYTSFSEHNGCWAKFAIPHNKEAEQKKILDSFLKTNYEGCIRLTDILKKKSISGITSTCNIYKDLKDSFITQPSHLEDKNRVMTFNRKLSNISELCPDGHPPMSVSMSTLHTIMLTVHESKIELKFVGDDETCCRTLSKACLLSIHNNHDNLQLDAIIKDLLGVSLAQMTSIVKHEQLTTTVVTVKVEKKLSPISETDIVYLILVVVTSISNVIQSKLGPSFKVETLRFDDQFQLIMVIQATSIKFQQQQEKQQEQQQQHRNITTKRERMNDEADEEKEEEENNNNNNNKKKKKKKMMMIIDGVGDDMEKDVDDEEEKEKEKVTIHDEKKNKRKRKDHHQQQQQQQQHQEVDKRKNKMRVKN